MTYAPLTREQMAWRAAQDLPEGAYVNLGIGIPTLAASYVPPGREVIFHSENGILGLGPKAEPGKEDPYMDDAGKNRTTLATKTGADRRMIRFEALKARFLGSRSPQMKMIGVASTGKRKSV